MPSALQAQSKVVLGKPVEMGLSGTAAALGFAGRSLARCPGALQQGRFPELPNRAAPGSGNRIRGLLVWSSRPNPAGRGKVRLGQKALAVRAWLWPADLCAGGGDVAPAADPSLLPRGWSQPPARSLRCGGCPPGRWHVLPRRGHKRAEHRAWERCAALARLRWASAGRADSPPRSSCCPAKFLFFSEIPSSVPGKNKWERSRCLALCRVAVRAQP